MSIDKSFQKILTIPQIIGKLLYPPRCPACDELLPVKRYKSGYCKTCARKIKRITGPSCFKCGRPMESETAEYCGTCKSRANHKFDQVKAVYIYKGSMKESMYRFKYANRRCYGETYAKDAMKLYGRWLKQIDPDIIIPVPMYAKKQKKRGYNQAEAFAKYLSQATGIPVKRDIVRRVRDTKPMKMFKDNGRRQNLENAFKLSEKVVKFRKVLLTDDIFTTGSTMDEIAQVLKENGVEKVYCLSVCTGVGD